MATVNENHLATNIKLDALLEKMGVISGWMQSVNKTTSGLAKNTSLLQLHAEDAASRLQHLEEGVHGRRMEGQGSGHADYHRRADRCYPTARRARRCTPARGRIWGSIDPPILLPTPVRPVAHLICSIASLTQMVHVMSITHRTIPLLVALLRWIFQNLMGGSPRCYYGDIHRFVLVYYAGVFKLPLCYYTAW
jgi:hypothetical protein